MKRKCLFLDRDGVINYDYGHVYKKSDFKFIPGIFRLVQLANRLNFLVIIITNQAGIAKGYYDLNQFEELTKWMLEEFKKRNCLIERVYYCPYHKDGIIKEYKKDSLDRKPNPGMLLKAAKDYSIDLEESTFKLLIISFNLYISSTTSSISSVKSLSRFEVFIVETLMFESLKEMPVI